MGLYGRYVYPRLMDLLCGMMGEMRPPTRAKAHGDVLEIGFGTGRNLGHYPPAVKSLTAADPMKALDARVASRIADAPFPVERRQSPADAPLPFDTGHFDCVVSTWTLCSVDDPPAALRELRRVLKPGGLFLFIEHGRCPDARTAVWQDRLTPLWRRILGGCRVNLKIDDLIRDAGFRLNDVEEFVPAGRSSFSDHQYRGSATR